MADTTFVDQSTVIVASWLNDVNDTVYQALGTGGVAPTTPAQVRANLGISSVGSTIIKGDGNGAYTNASASDVVSLLGSTPVNNATAATTATTATTATNATNVTGTIASGVTATTQTAGDNSTKVATTAYVDAAASVLRGHIDGYTLSTVGSSTTMTIAAGQATNSVNTGYITLASAINKTTSAWAVGSGNGGLDTGTIANSTWYYFYAIRRPDTGVVDVVFSTNSSSPTLPTNYTQFRYIGAGLTNGSAQWTRFFQYGDLFRWDTPVQDFNGAGVTTASLLTLSVPRGRKMQVLVSTQGVSGGTGGNGVYLSDPDASDLAVTGTGLANAWHTADPGGESMTVQSTCVTNTSGQVRRRHWNTATMQITTFGWTDLRGRNG